MKHPDKMLSMIEFILWMKENEGFNMLVIELYAELLTLPLSLEMFIVVKDGKVLKKPDMMDYGVNEFTTGGGSEVYKDRLKKYEQASKKILFSDFELVVDWDNVITFNNGNIGMGMYKKTHSWFIGENKKPIEKIEDLVKLDLTGTDNFWNKLFKP